MPASIDFYFDFSSPYGYFASTRIDAIAAPLGIDRTALLTAVGDPAVKERLKREIDAALARGVFGSPFVFVDGEPFWGSDRLDQVEEWLATGGW